MHELIIIDGLCLLFRSFYATPLMVNAKGQNIGGIHGFINQLRKIIKAKNPLHVIVAFDTGEKTWRHDTMTEYKANRKASPIELRHQFQWARDACTAMNIDYVESSGYEADDICATYVERYRHEYKICIASIDKDMMQLVQHNVTMYDPFKRVDIDIDDVVRRFCVRPDQIVDFLAMVGDASDGVVGVTGVGPKTAARWLNLYNDIDGIMQNLSALIPSRLANVMRDEYEGLKMAQHLIKLRTDVNIPPLCSKPMKYDVGDVGLLDDVMGAVV